ncbi:MAG: hypothetical protein A2428_01025 [Bdellovibrionales bacterium RIFOXYC1_FULL_54_43]|nr:MAG: hypothetical protein A2428_01025 [Bdellovibrionales bacterium RIFOXYC1_FULL_54_43]OFZ82867.1 MAG: hypothetical protein A2603_11750 [Bdellovibrionales bacterium RIFOXYD1_FULL_55_31]
MWMTVEEVAAYLRVSRETIYKLVQQNKIPASKLGNQWRFNRERVDQWLSAKSNYDCDQTAQVSNG